MPGSARLRFAGLVATVLAVLVTPALAEAQTTTSTPTTTSAPPTGRVTGRAWHDLDADRVVDAGEVAVAGVEVLLIDGSGRLADRPPTASTDAAGRFEVVVATGTYQACFATATGDLWLQAITNPAAPGAWTAAVNRNCSEVFAVVAGAAVQVDGAYGADLPPGVVPPGRPPTDPRGVLAITGVDVGTRLAFGGLLLVLGLAAARVSSRLSARAAR